MGNNMGRARELESPADDESESGLRDALDFSIADPADSPTLDDQTVSDILESGSYDDDSDDMDDAEKTMDEHLSRLVQETETIDSETLLATSRIKRSPFVKTSWTQRVLSWFRRG